MDIGNLARDLLDRTNRRKAVNGNVKYNTKDLREHYRISDSTVVKVKRETKRIAAKQDQMWGWDPGVNHFRVCPRNAVHVASRMIEYAHSHWGDGGVSVNYMLQGAKGTGFITPETTKNAKARNRRYYRGIRENGLNVSASVE